MTYKKIEQHKNKYKFEVKLDYSEFEQERNKVIQSLSKNVKVPGFRPGKAPKDAVEKEVGYKAYMEAVNRILPRNALEVVEKENINPISSFKYDLKDLEKDKEITFTFECITQPEVKLEDFKKIKVEYKEPELGKDEADLVIKNIIKTSLPREKWEKNIKTVSKKHEQKENEAKNTGSSDEDIEITDDLVAEIGYEDEKTYEGLKKKVEETLEKVKKEDAENQFASKVIEEALKIADFEIPEDFVDHEKEHKEEHFIERLKDLKLDQEMYLKTQGSSIEDLRKTWEEEARKNIKTDLLLVNLGVSEKLVPTEKEVEAEIEKLEDPQLKKQYEKPDNKVYLQTNLTRYKALQKLIESVRQK